MTVSGIRHNTMTAHCLRDAIEWWITDNYPELLDDELSEAIQDQEKRDEAIEKIIECLKEGDFE